MNRFKLGVPLDALGPPPRQALAVAANLGVHGVQFDATGELSADKLGDTARRELRTLLRSYNLEPAAIHLPLRRGLDAVEHQQMRIEHVTKALQLAYDIGAKKVVAPMPAVPADETEARAVTLRETLTAVARAADRVGSTLALECGHDPGAKVRDYLATYDTGGLAVTYDPANFLMNGHDPLAAMGDLAGRIAYVHARDARRGYLRGGGEEVPVGAGDIEWMLYVATLEATDYRGYLTVQRGPVATRAADIAAGVKFMRRFVGPVG